MRAQICTPSAACCTSWSAGGRPSWATNRWPSSPSTSTRRRWPPPGIGPIAHRPGDVDPASAGERSVQSARLRRRGADRARRRSTPHGAVMRPGPPSPSPRRSSEPGPLYRETFVGREAELRQLSPAYDAALSGQGGMVMVVGEPGIGKTALCEQLATYAAVRGGTTLVGHCYEEGSLEPAVPAVRRGAARLRARPGARGADDGPGQRRRGRCAHRLRGARAGRRWSRARRAAMPRRTAGACWRR